ncbi:hypothetical protein [Solimonas terrae]|uniref:ParB N-terminal domain-containing protein n=1 Tax=Solimonas terrae TaxID=1396819 RepID=A0A6M2BS85_9GAMM|nr:hypothetical protein [Solimonas terrae]NGY04963.1 hypothetical protein [Solimonas terrae]
MVVSASVRKEKLSELLKSKPEGTQKLFYKGRAQTFPVHRISLDLLIFNEHNGRIEAEMLTWMQEHQAPTAYTQEKHDKIKSLLWELNEGRNEATLADLKKKQQQRPGIVSLDGVIIDGNRRAMLLERLGIQEHQPQYLEAIILPDAYADNEKEIVRLETQYQLGEDAKVEYGPIQKYLHARRLRVDLDIKEEEIDSLMGREKGYAARLLAIMQLMDAYLDHIGCPRLYTMLKDADGTKEGMFVDLYSDLKRIEGKNAKVPWVQDEFDQLRLRTIQFDYIRFGEFADAKKSYRAISHQGNSKNFYCHEDIWREFAGEHGKVVDPITATADDLETYIAKNPHHGTKTEAAIARDREWRDTVDSAMKRNFGTAGDKLYYRMEVLKPRELLVKAKLALEKIDIEDDSLIADPDNLTLVRELNQLTYEMKKRFERRG